LLNSKTRENDLHGFWASVGTSGQLALEIGQWLVKCGGDVWRDLVNGRHRGVVDNGGGGCELAGSEDLVDAARWRHSV
jgi:hypothetical protein